MHREYWQTYGSLYSPVEEQSLEAQIRGDFEAEFGRSDSMPEARIDPEPADENRAERKTDYAMTHREIAAELGITWQRVQQIEKAALKKLRVRLARALEVAV